MFAVLKTGGKQYKVQAGDVLRVERLAAEAGETVQFNEILMLGGETNSVGSPMITGAAVQATVIDQIKGEKLIHYVKRRRKHSSQRTKGHRQKLTLVRITEILASGADKTGVKAAIGTGSLSASAKAAMTPASNKGAAPKAAAKVAAAPKAAAPKAAKAAPAAGGDLKKLEGVGPALEKKLIEGGVTSLAQIAGWSAEEVAAFDEKLNLKGRIERDGWVDQAKALIAG
jgi:large subunit ribosomal protein L21